MKVRGALELLCSTYEIQALKQIIQRFYSLPDLE
jgi:hypothetical protein